MKSFIRICVCGLLRGFGKYPQVESQFNRSLLDPLDRAGWKAEVLFVVDPKEEHLSGLKWPFLVEDGVWPSHQMAKMQACVRNTPKDSIVIFTRPDLLYLEPFDPSQIQKGVSARVRLASSHLHPFLSEDMVSYGFGNYGWNPKSSFLGKVPLKDILLDDQFIVTDQLDAVRQLRRFEKGPGEFQKVDWHERLVQSLWYGAGVREAGILKLNARILSDECETKNFWHCFHRGDKCLYPACSPGAFYDPSLIKAVSTPHPLSDKKVG